MTISNSTNKSGPYNGNGTTTVFARSFRVIDANHLKVYQTISGVTTEVTTGITKDGIGDDSGNVTFDTAPATGTQITLIREIPLTQETDYSSQGKVAPVQVEEDLDLQEMQIQDMNEKVYRSLKVPVTDAGGDDAVVDAKPGQYLRMKEDGSGYEGMDAQLAVNQVDAWFQNRDATSMLQGSLLTNGSIFYAHGLAYQTDSSVSMSDSAAGDLGVAGVKPHGDVVYPAHYGGGASGAAKALNYEGASVVDLQGERITLADTIVVTRGNVRVRNMNFDGDISASTETNRPSVMFRGSFDAAVNLTADAAADSAAITAGGTPQPVAVDQWVRIRDDRSLWSGGTAGELAQVRDVSGTAGAWVVKFYEPLALAYTTAENARIEPANMLTNIVIEGGVVAGNTATDNQTALRFFACDNVTVDNHKATDTDYAHVIFDACGRVFVEKGRGMRTGAVEGLDYGIGVINGTFLAEIDRYHGSTQRHATVTGGSIGAVKHYRVKNCRGDDLLEAGFDAHPPTINTTIKDCEAYVRDGLATSADGVICQGLNFVATGNHIWGMTRHGVFHQPTINVGASPVKSQCKISGNRAETDQQAFNGVGYVLSRETTAGVDIEDVVISDNFAKGVTHVAQMFLKAGEAEYCDISRNRGVATVRGAQIRANSGATIDRWKLSENKVEVESGGSEGLYVLEMSGGSIGDGILASNHVIGGTSAFRLVGAGDVVSDGGNVSEGSTAFWSLSGNDSVRFDELLSGEVTFNPGSLAAGESVSTTVTVTGAQPGDVVVGVSHSTSLLGDVVLDVEGVVGTNVVRVHYTNLGAVARDVTSGTLRAFVRKV